MKKIVLIGAGGHCKVIIDIIKTKHEYDIIGITDTNIKQENILGVPILGDDSILPELYLSGVKDAFICIGALEDISFRNKFYNKLKKLGFQLPVLIHKNSIVSSYVKIGDGSCVMPGVVINPNVNIGYNCIINSSSIIEHDCYIGNNSHIASKSALGGGVSIGYNTFIGMGTSVIQGIKIGNNVIVGAGAVVIDNISDNSIAVGVPARIIRLNLIHK